VTNSLIQKVDSFQSFEKARYHFHLKVSLGDQVGNLLDILHSRHTGSDSDSDFGFDFDLGSGTDIEASAAYLVDDSSTQY
jgi:hypothetical protein